MRGRIGIANLLAALILTISTGWSAVYDSDQTDKGRPLPKVLKEITEAIIDSYTHYQFDVVVIDAGWALDIQVHYHHLDRHRLFLDRMQRTNNLRLLLSELAIGLQNLGRKQEDLENRKYIFVKFMQVYVDGNERTQALPAFKRDEVESRLDKIVSVYFKGLVSHSMALFKEKHFDQVKYIVEYLPSIEQRLLGPGGVRAMAIKETLNEVSIGMFNRSNLSHRERFVGRVVPLVRFRSQLPGKGRW